MMNKQYISDSTPVATKNWASDAKLNECFDSHMAAVSNRNGYSMRIVLAEPAHVAVSSLLKFVVVAKAHIAKICTEGGWV